MDEAHLVYHDYFLGMFNRTFTFYFLLSQKLIENLEKHACNTTFAQKFCITLSMEFYVHFIMFQCEKC